MSTQTLILTGVGLYVIAMLAIGFITARASHTITDFALAGRAMPLWLCSASIFATWFGTGIMMGAATSGYDRDMLAMLAEPFGSALALFLSGAFFARIYRRTRRLTWMEFFEARYGKVAGVFAALSDVFSSIIWIGGLLFTFGVLLESLAGVPTIIGIFGGLFVVAVYTMAGGMWAVAVTDFVQMLALVFGLLILLVVVLHDVGGWSTIAAQLPEHTLRPIPLDHTAKNWFDWLNIWLVMGFGAIAATSIIQRALAARSETVAQNAFYLASVGYVVIGTIPIVLGLIASVTMPGIDNPNAVLAELAVRHLHPALVVVFVGAIISALMSTCDSVLLGVGTVTSTNLLPLVVRNPDDKLRLRVARYAIPVASLLGTYVALNAHRVVQVLLDSAAILLAAIIVPFVLCFYWERANNYGALTGLFGGLAGWLIASWQETALPPEFLGFCVSLVGMVTVTLFTQKLSPPRPLTDCDGNVVVLRDRLGVAGLRRSGGRR